MASKPVPNRSDSYERASRLVTLALAVVAVGAAAAAPFLAIAWTNHPFPGFMVEPTVVVSDRNGEGWPGQQAGIDYPQRVVRIAGAAVTNGAEFNAVLTSEALGSAVSVFTRLPDGSTRLYPTVGLVHLTLADMVRLFWVPYGIGVAYLGVGIWMYRLRGKTRPGRAFVVFSLSTSLACTLLFDLTTTHVGAGVWTVAVATIGGALISLALRFPQEWEAVGRRPWLLGVPYLVSIGIAIWGATRVYDMSRPWAYIEAWGYAYRYIALGIVAFMTTMLYRARSQGTPLVRQQARIVLVGSLLGFTPFAIWAIAPLLGMTVPFSAVLLLPGLMLFPFAIAIAIFRYRLLEAEVIVNRTIFYGLLTAVLAGVFSVMSWLTQQFFLRTTGRRSDAAIIITTLVVVSTMEPIKQRVNNFIRTRFKDIPHTTDDLEKLGSEVRTYLQMNDCEQISRHLLETSAGGLAAQSGAITLFVGGQSRVVHTHGRWTGDARLVVPLEAGGQRIGLLALGPRASQEPYTQHECLVLLETATQVARSIKAAVSTRPG